MGVMTVQGVCVGLKDETIKYNDADGRAKEFRSIGASFADPSGQGEPIDVIMSEAQYKQLQPFKEYQFPVEARVVTTKKGSFCRISILEGAMIERVAPTIQPNQAPPPAPPK